MSAALDDLGLLAALGESGTAPRSFVEFTERIGVHLYPGQSALASVAFDGAEPRDIADVELRRRLFGDVEVVPPMARATFVAVCGARAGKSFVLGGLRMLHLALTCPLGTLARGEQAIALIVAPDMRLAGQTLRYSLGAALGVPWIAQAIDSKTATSFRIRRPDGVVSVECLPATRGGTAVRGRSLVGAVLDESAFFRDDSYQVNDVELYRAVAPRIMTGGQLVIASTPWTENGLLWDFFQRNHGHPVDALAAHAPTLLLRDTDETRGIVERERARDETSARREFDAEFMSSAGDTFFDADSIRGSIDPELQLPMPIRGPAYSGADFGFRNDSSAIVAVQRVGNKFVTSLIEEQKPEPKKPLKPSAVVAEFAKLAKAQGVTYLVADSHYRQAIEEHLHEHALTLLPAPEGASGKADSYQLVRSLLREGRIVLPNHDRLLRQLREVVARPISGGGVSIVSPRWRSGGHGDIVSAFVLAIWDAARYDAPVEEPKHETAREAEAAAWQQKLAERVDRENAEAEAEAIREAPDWWGQWE